MNACEVVVVTGNVIFFHETKPNRSLFWSFYSFLLGFGPFRQFFVNLSWEAAQVTK